MTADSETPNFACGKNEDRPKQTKQEKSQTICINVYILYTVGDQTFRLID